MNYKYIYIYLLRIFNHWFILNFKFLFKNKFSYNYLILDI